MRTLSGAKKNSESLIFEVYLTAFNADKNKPSATAFSQGGKVPLPRTGQSLTKISVERAILFGRRHGELRCEFKQQIDGVKDSIKEIEKSLNKAWAANEDIQQETKGYKDSKRSHQEMLDNYTKRIIQGLQDIHFHAIQHVSKATTCDTIDSTPTRPQLCLIIARFEAESYSICQKPAQEIRQIQRYAISPVKKATFSSTRYFSCNIHKKDQVVICFNPTKRPNLYKYEQAQTAVTLHNVRSTKKDGIQSIIIRNNTTMEPVTVPFGFQHAAVSPSLPSIASLQEVSVEQLVQIKAKVSNISGIKQIATRYGQSLQKHEVILIDHSTSIKLILWQEPCDKLEKDKTYSLQNITLKESNGTRYLNTAKSEPYGFQAIPPFTQKLATVATDMEPLSHNKMSAKIIGI
ncbi:hypothetical protein ACROYT_G015216 [Oculina patagonica]